MDSVDINLKNLSDQELIELLSTLEGLEEELYDLEVNGEQKNEETNDRGKNAKTI